MSSPAQPVPRIFVSHSHYDNSFCRPFVAHLRSALGLTDPDHIFYDENTLHLGDAWLERIQHEVLSRPVFILILTPHAVFADYVRRETNLALRETIQHHERRIYSLLVEPCDPNTLAPMLLDYQMADFVNKRYEVVFAEVVEALRAGASANAGPQAPGAAASPLPMPPPNPQATRARALAEEAQRALEAGHYADALLKADFALTLPENQANAGLQGVLALACVGAQQWERAREAAQRALALDPFRADLWRALAQAQAALGQPDEALAALDRARAILPLDESARTARLEVLTARRELLVRQQRWAEALQTLDDELALAGSDPARLSARLDLLRRAGREREALALARVLTAQPGATAAQWLARAELAHQLGEDINEVRTALDAAARLAPADPAIAQARKQLLVIIPPERFPPRLTQLGYVGQRAGAVEYLVPPLCTVPSSDFLLGSNPKQDTQASGDETPQHRVTLAAFQIARFPVTVAEYACFVRAGQNAPQNWQAQLGGLDHPVVYVSWRDAVAYAGWLAQRTGQPWRLPTEAEWEKAARWDPAQRHARIYPWGDAFDQARCNTSEDWKGGTTPVGSYPNGASPCGAQDMAGNVWEWTSSLLKPYPYRVDDGRERADSTENRVLRGGSWGNGPKGSRAACRNHNDPGNFGNFVGFRLVLAVPGS